MAIIVLAFDDDCASFLLQVSGFRVARNAAARAAKYEKMQAND